MKTSLYFLSNGMTIIAQASDNHAWGSTVIQLTDAYEVFVTPDEQKLRFTLMPAFSLYNMLPYKSVIAIPQASIVCVREPTPLMVQHYETKRAQGETL